MDHSIILLLSTLLCLACLPGAYQDDSWDIIEKCPALEDDGLSPQPPTPRMRHLAQKPGKDLAGVPDNVKQSRNTFIQKRTFPTKPRPDECENCNPFIYRTVIGVKGCEDKPKLRVLIIVTSVPGEPQMRQVIRETWGKETEETKTVFLFGVGWGMKEQKILDAEGHKYGDILQENYVDSYFNLTLKVLSGFHWWSRKCGNALFVLRTASDCFINIPNLLKLTKTAPDLMVGTCGISKPNRNVMNRFYVSPNEYPENKKSYPTFCLGTAFLSPTSITKRIIEKSPFVPYFPLEDVYFGLLLVYMNRPPIPIHGFSAQYKKEEGKCKIAANWINLHPIPHALEMRWIAENCKTTED